MMNRENMIEAIWVTSQDDGLGYEFLLPTKRNARDHSKYDKLQMVIEEKKRKTIKIELGLVNKVGINQNDQNSSSTEINTEDPHY